MISKEKLINGHIENDRGKFRELFVEAAIFYGYKIPFDKDIDWLDYEYLYTDERTMDIVTGRNPLFKNNKLTLEDFVDEGVTQQPEINVENCTFTSNDIFQQMLVLSQQHNVLIQFDGLAEEVVVTCQDSDKEYTVTNKQDFDNLINSLKALSKFERS